METILLSKNDIESFFTMRLCMDAVESAFADLARGDANMPQRTPIFLPEKQGVSLFMPAHIKSMGALGAKVVSVFKNNMKARNLPVVLGLILLLDEDTGFPLAIMDGGYLTAMRTGAVSGVATRYMAKKDAKITMIFGAGVQAFTQVLAVQEARPMEKLLVYAIDPIEKQRQFADRVTEKTGVPVELVDEPGPAVQAADIVILATSSADPIVKGGWFKPGTHINGIGSHAPNMRELDSLTVQKSRIICDQTNACRAEAGDLMIPADAGEWNWNLLAGELGDVVLGKIPGRTRPDEITLFKSVGLAIQDLSSAKIVYDEAIKRGVGTPFQF